MARFMFITFIHCLELAQPFVAQAQNNVASHLA
jgi:hypothetical protein